MEVVVFRRIGEKKEGCSINGDFLSCMDGAI